MQLRTEYELQQCYYLRRQRTLHWFKNEWKNEINLDGLKTKVTSLVYSLEDEYVDDSKEILGKIFKDNDCEVPINDDKVLECVETEKDAELIV